MELARWWTFWRGGRAAALLWPGAGKQVESGLDEEALWSPSQYSDALPGETVSCWCVKSLSPLPDGAAGDVVISRATAGSLVMLWKEVAGAGDNLC